MLTAYDDDRSEAEGVASFLLDRAGAGIPWSAHAVLARTHDQLAVVRRALERAGIPCRTGSASADGVELATFHRAKGLEWEAVCVVGLEDGFVPIVHAMTSETLAEERRLLYVALTRASNELHCSWARTRTMSRGRAVERRPSPWLAALARVSRTGQGRISREGRRSTHRRAAGGTQRLTAPRRARVERACDRIVARQIVVSMNTGAWSDGF